MFVNSIFPFSGTLSPKEILTFAKIIMKNLQNKKIGIWGYGVVGASARSYLKPFTHDIGIFDHKELPPATRMQLEHDHLRIYAPTELVSFLDDHEYIITSPGIDLHAYQHYADKFVAEFDLFCAAWHKPIIAITGTLGKTTITSLLSQLLQAVRRPVATGGNIGTGMLDLMAQQGFVTAALLELSSFQLELCRQAAPDLAVITNIFPNHLDRHATVERYRAAKYKIFSAQNEHQQALVPLQLMQEIRTHFPAKKFHYFSSEKPSHADYALLAEAESLYYLNEQTIHRYAQARDYPLATLPAINSSYPANWLIIYALLDLLGIDLTLVTQLLPTLTVPDHRLACIAEHHGIRFYNDSKATVPEAMLAAVKKLQGAPIVLFLGGISKGVDRTAAIAELAQCGIKEVICFGKEAAELKACCEHYCLPASAHATLEAAFEHTMQLSRSGDQLLFSPAGASFDLFKDYQARGDRFKQLVKEFIENPTALQ